MLKDLRLHLAEATSNAASYRNASVEIMANRNVGLESIQTMGAYILDMHDRLLQLQAVLKIPVEVSSANAQPIPYGVAENPYLQVGVQPRQQIRYTSIRSPDEFYQVGSPQAHPSSPNNWVSNNGECQDPGCSCHQAARSRAQEDRRRQEYERLQMAVQQSSNPYSGIFATATEASQAVIRREGSREVEF